MEGVTSFLRTMRICTGSDDLEDNGRMGDGLE